MSSSASEPPAPSERAQDRGFFGQPRGLMTLFTTELWERFSYYGMRAILVLYITDAVVDGGLGYDETTGNAIGSVYGSSVYLLSIVGGWLADRVVGARRSVLYGGVVIAAGHVSLAIPQESFTWIGLVLVALGTGLLKPNVSAMVGELYDRDDPRRDAGFSIFYMGINLGSLFAPLVVGSVQGIWGYHAGFSVAAVGMAIALVFFVLGRRYLHGAGDAVPNPVRGDERAGIARMFALVVAGIAVIYLIAVALTGSWGGTTFVDALSYLALVTPVVYFVVMYRSPKVVATERSRLLAYIPLFVAAMLFWMIFEQAATTLTTFARDHTELTVLGFEVSPAFFQSINPASIILLAPVFAWLWQRTGGRPPTPYKFALGLALAAASFLFLSGASAVVGDDRAPAWVLIVVYVVQTLGELCLSPVGLAATTLLAPKAFRGQAMALWFLANASGQAITAQLVQVTEGASDTAYFGWIGVVALAVAGLMWALSPWVMRHIRAADEAEGVRTAGA